MRAVSIFLLKQIRVSYCSFPFYKLLGLVVSGVEAVIANELVYLVTAALIPFGTVLWESKIRPKVFDAPATS